jgi:hypothetical protein
MNWQDLLPPEARYLISCCRAMARRMRGDDGEKGEIGIIGAIIMVVGFAVAAGLLVAAVKGKLNSWISQIPG